MELKKMPVVAIMHKGIAIETYTVQTANETYKLEKSFGEYAKMGYFTIVSRDGSTHRHFLPKKTFHEEILRFNHESIPRAKTGRPSNEDRLMSIEQKLDKLLEAWDLNTQTSKHV